MADMLDELALTRAAVARLLHTSRDTVDELIAEGLPTMRCGRRVLIVRTALERWLEENATTAFPSRPKRPSEAAS